MQGYYYNDWKVPIFFNLQQFTAICASKVTGELRGKRFPTIWLILRVAGGISMSLKMVVIIIICNMFSVYSTTI